MSDPRLLPRIPMKVFVRAGLVMFWARLGSLRALRQSEGSRFWKHWLRHKMPSDDSMGRVYALLDAISLRKGLHEVYTRLKRNKALKGIAGLTVAVLDGHETHTAIGVIAMDVCKGGYILRKESGSSIITGM